MVTVHYLKDDGMAPCGRDASKLTRTKDRDEVTCGQCVKALNAADFVGVSRGREQFKVKCRGGPWGGSIAVFPAQYTGDLSLPIRVGEHVGRYSLNTGHWVPSEQQA